MFMREDVDQLVESFLLLKSKEEVRAFLVDLCTPREITDLAQRLEVARVLDDGKPYVEAQAHTGASSTTVSRVSKALNGTWGGYRNVLIRLNDQLHEQG
ncbi:TrpR-like protein YerC/YecD [Collinsella sp. zg1085]|nr:TrpR-like protein YerC/YecD [Collinsella sp. zg1085]